MLGSGSTTLVDLNGVNFQNASEIRVSPATGVAIGTISVSADSTSISVPFVIAANAPTGPRTIVVVTPAGETSAIAGLNNTLTIYSGNAVTQGPIVAPLLGVVLNSSVNPTPTTSTVDPIVAPLLGVVLTANPPAPSTVDYQITSLPLTVALGAVATSVQTTALNRGVSGTITVNGFGLSGVTALSVSPATDIVLGALTVNPDGLSLSIPISVGATAAFGLRTVLLKAGAAAVSFARAIDATFGIAGPRIDSIEPILGNRNSIVSLLIRGVNLQFTDTVTITPADGVTLEPNPTVDATGTQVTLRMRIDANAAIGARRIQVITPGGSSSAISAPANTFTIN